MQLLHLQGGDITAGAAGLPAVKRCCTFKYLDSVRESAEYKNHFLFFPSILPLSHIQNHFFLPEWTQG